MRSLLRRTRLGPVARAALRAVERPLRAGRGFAPGRVWLDTDGRPIQAHAGGILRHDGRSWWYGEDKDAPTVGGRVDVVGVSCYSSADLRAWTRHGLALAAVRDDPAHDLHPAKVCERPKVVYNPSTRRFVMWMHVDSADYRYARAGVAVSESPHGPFTYLGSRRPIDDQLFRDCNLLVAPDGRAYVFYASEDNATLYVSRLDASWTDVERPAIEGVTWRRSFVRGYREAPAPFAWNGRCWLITSGCTGWRPNAADIAVADEPLGPYASLGDPCVGRGGETTFGCQVHAVIPAPDGPEGVFIALADRWNPRDLRDSRAVWLPFRMPQAGRPRIAFRRRWDLGDLATLSPA